MRNVQATSPAWFEADHNKLLKELIVADHGDLSREGSQDHPKYNDNAQYL